MLRLDRPEGKSTRHCRLSAVYVLDSVGVWPFWRRHSRGLLEALPADWAGDEAGHVTAGYGEGMHE